MLNAIELVLSNGPVAVRLMRVLLPGNAGDGSGIARELRDRDGMASTTGYRDRAMTFADMHAAGSPTSLCRLNRGALGGIVCTTKSLSVPVGPRPDEVSLQWTI